MQRNSVVTPAILAKETELAEARAKTTQLRRELRRMRNNARSVTKLHERFSKQISYVKWLGEQIAEVEPGFDPIQQYKACTPQRPAPRGPKPKNSAS